MQRRREEHVFVDGQTGIAIGRVPMFQNRQRVDARLGFIDRELSRVQEGETQDRGEDDAAKQRNRRDRASGETSHPATGIRHIRSVRLCGRAGRHEIDDNTTDSRSDASR